MVVHADETSWRHDGRQYWVWYAGDDDLAFFHLDEHRSTEAAQSVLGQRFGGTIVADAFASYKGVHPKDWQSCLAHIKTKAKELEQEITLLKGKAGAGLRAHCLPGSSPALGGSLASQRPPKQKPSSCGESCASCAALPCAILKPKPFASACWDPSKSTSLLASGGLRSHQPTIRPSAV